MLKPRIGFPSKLGKGFIRAAGIIAVLVLILHTSYIILNENVRTSSLLLTDSNRSRCCNSTTSSLDFCGFPNCVQCSIAEARLDISSHGRDVFFHETSFSTLLSARQACAVESVALNNPDLTIHLLTTNILHTTSITNALNSYSNIKISHIQLSDYFAGTPLQEWYFCSNRLSSPYAVSHLSDALRFLTLYKYGGYYFDLDIVMLKPVQSMVNFTGAESSKYVAVGAMHFDVSHPVIQAAVADFAANYQPDDWGANGPRLLTRVLHRWCGSSSVEHLWAFGCSNVIVYPPHVFYPIPWKDWKKYFALERDSEFPTLLQGSVTAHVWNKLSQLSTINRGSNQMYAKIAAQFCPKVNAAAGELF